MNTVWEEDALDRETTTLSARAISIYESPGE